MDEMLSELPKVEVPIRTIDYRSRPLVRAALKNLRDHRTILATDTSYDLNRISEALLPRMRVSTGSKDVALCTVALGDKYRASVELCIETQAIFAGKRGYTHAVLEDWTIVRERPPAWMRLPLIVKLLNAGYKHVVYIDADAMVTNYASDFSDAIRRLNDTETCICITEDEGGLNSGVMIIRNSQETLALLQLIWLYDADLENPTWEQNALKFLAENYPEVRRHILIEANPRAFNSFPIERRIFHDTQLRNLWSSGDFICHFSGIRKPHLESFIKRYARALNLFDASHPGLLDEPVRVDTDEVKITHAIRTPKDRRPTVTFSKLGRWGQFGNQLFHISAVLGYAARHDAEPLLPRWVCEKNGIEYDALYPQIKNYYGQPPESDLYEEPNFAYYEIPFAPHIDLRGNFQSEFYFRNVSSTIKQLFAEPAVLKSRLDAFCVEHDLSDFDGIHIRNYSLAPDNQGDPMARLPDQYYVMALKELEYDRPLLITTDDRRLTQNFIESLDIRRPYLLIRSEDALIDFYLLSRAKRLAISNSSFSWWAAYLGGPDNIVFAPHRYYWFKAEERKNKFWDPRDLYPARFKELIS